MTLVLVIGSGARESIIIKKVLDDAKKINERVEIICIKTQENTYIDDMCMKAYPMKNDLYETMLQIDEEDQEEIGFCIIGPEAPLEQQYADYFEIQQIPCIGPMQYYAQLETSKHFCRNFLHSDTLLKKYSPKFKIIEPKEKTYESIQTIFYEFDEIVIKKDGLCGGKGVTVQGYDFFDKDEQINSILESKDTYVIEEKLVGEEFSFLSITDGSNHLQHFPPMQDNKRLLDNDKGPNTGGMGCVIDENNTLPFLTDNDINIVKKINENVIYKLNNHKSKQNLCVGYRGVLYGSYIKTENGIYIIEFNCRFGDPECIIALSLLETNFYSVCLEIISGNLQTPLSFSKDAMICLYAVPENYPKCKDNDTEYDIYFDSQCDFDKIIYGNVKMIDNHTYSLKSRTLCCISRGKKLYECYKNVYNDIKLIHGNLHYRKDIGRKFLTKYEQAGVSIKNGDLAIENIKANVFSTYNENVVSEIGSFGGEFKLGNETLVASIDGVGTKSILAKRFFNEEAYYNLGKDIVGHSINDILVQGARPLFFLDYFGANSLNLNEFEYFVQGLTDSCLGYGPFPILGGETAEMPLIYKKDETDLIGCIVGKKDKRFFPNTVKKGDIVINLPSVSPHTNGYSLINKIVDETIDKEMIKTLLEPHKCYLHEVLTFVKTFGYDKLNAMCHITGGGFHGNMKRVLPENMRVDLDDIELPNWCTYLMEKGVSYDEMMQVFNCGIGFVLIVDNSVDLSKFNVTHKIIGKIVE
jgi:phosphoribosylamine--glycine ligase/phosphoribosylaminoimidazole synthetase